MIKIGDKVKVINVPEGDKKFYSVDDVGLVIDVDNESYFIDFLSQQESMFDDGRWFVRKENVIKVTENHYKPLQIIETNVTGIGFSLRAMRLPMPQKKSYFPISENLERARKLVKSGDDHAKFARGIVVHFTFRAQVGWILQWLTYRIGVECLSSSSAMHDELVKMTGVELAEKKQRDLVDKTYTRMEMVSYQALRHVYMGRRHHRHPDWMTLCDWIEELPYFDSLIYPENYVEENFPGEPKS